MHEQIVRYETIQTLFGPLTLTTSDEYLLRVDFGSFTDNEQKIKTYLSRAKFSNYIKEATINHPIKNELIAYFNQTLTTFTVPQKFYGTDFQRDVWQALLSIPYGETVSYKDIAVMIDRPKAVRAVGGALNKNPFSIVVPCHRVIGSDGSLTGFGGGLDRKQQLLTFEQPLK
ncbi:MAG TPA: methylated-DNA--[protein]-cysteine S-methyltransferase [Bacillota bacterium]|nr:methylated-DNA--[protein]-cysteine S-methyltransferase [Bacillota bacterium]